MRSANTATATTTEGGGGDVCRERERERERERANVHCPLPSCACMYVKTMYIKSVERWRSIPRDGGSFQPNCPKNVYLLTLEKPKLQF